MRRYVRKDSITETILYLLQNSNDMLVLVVKNADFEVFDKEDSLHKVNKKTIEVKKFPVLIGRLPDPDLPSIVFSKSPAVSGKHCYLFDTTKEGICVLDSSSKNGTVIMRNKGVIVSVKKGIKTSLKDGDELVLPGVSIKVSIYD